MSSPTKNEVAGHPIAIRAGGRRISQSHPRRPSVSSASVSPPDGAPANAAKDNVPPTGDGYPRPETGHTEGNANGGNEDNGGHHQDKEEQIRRKKKQGIKSDEAKNLALNNAGSSSGRAPRHAASPMDARIQQPTRAMAI